MIRIFQYGDERKIAEIFRGAVHEIARDVYSAEQCLAWSSTEPDYDRWEKRCGLKRPFIYQEDGEIAGFLELDTDGHIDCAYINPKYQRRGIMSQLVRHAVSACHSMGLERVYAEASICAKPLFEKLGFNIIREKQVTINGVALQNYDMELVMDGLILLHQYK
jgi:putative acetyltransferase